MSDPIIHGKMCKPILCIYKLFENLYIQYGFIPYNVKRRRYDSKDEVSFYKESEDEMDYMENVADFLSRHSESLVEEWRKQVLVSIGDPFQEKIFENGMKMYQLIIGRLRNEYDEKTIEVLACRVAEERIEANINIGEFVYNVNIGRSEIFKYLSMVEMSLESLQPAINQINECFDLFLYHAVSHYTELKDKMIEEKSTFINATHQDRLSLLGQMTSSLIHEFRNPLTSVKGFIKLLAKEYPDMKYIDIISRELEQLNFRVSQFLMLSKKEIAGKEKQAFYMDKLIDEVTDFLYPSLLTNQINLSKDIHHNVMFYGYFDEIRQVLINILFNAIDALYVIEEERNIDISLKESPGEIILSISNNGPIIDEVSLHTIFEPFVTTKELGTGLGLFVCKQIIEKHGGSISIHSEKKITTFSIHLLSEKDGFSVVKEQGECRMEI